MTCPLYPEIGCNYLSRQKLDGRKSCRRNCNQHESSRTSLEAVAWPELMACCRSNSFTAEGVRRVLDALHCLTSLCVLDLSYASVMSI